MTAAEHGVQTLAMAFRRGEFGDIHNGGTVSSEARRLGAVVDDAFDDQFLDIATFFPMLRVGEQMFFRAVANGCLRPAAMTDETVSAQVGDLDFASF